MEMENRAYPVTLRGELTVPPARGWWLLKWLLAIPHWIILFFLYIAFAVVCIISFFAIVFTGKHPKSLFAFKVGVLRWSWRVGFYSYEALGTDKYPPFSLKPDDSYPADLDIPYPERLSRGLVWVKWWLLAIPHYIIVAIFTNGLGGWPFWGYATGAERWCMGNWTTCPALPAGWQMSNDGGPALISILVLFAAIALLFTGSYPKSIFKLVIGFNRWVYRVVAYVTLMTDKYPPFRLWDD